MPVVGDAEVDAPEGGVDTTVGALAGDTLEEATNGVGPGAEDAAGAGVASGVCGATGAALGLETGVTGAAGLAAGAAGGT